MVMHILVVVIESYKDQSVRDETADDVRIGESWDSHSPIINAK
jgi:hypothetical protein